MLAGLLARSDSGQRWPTGAEQVTLLVQAVKAWGRLAVSPDARVMHRAAGLVAVIPSGSVAPGGRQDGVAVGD